MKFYASRYFSVAFCWLLLAGVSLGQTEVEKKLTLDIQNFNMQSGYASQISLPGAHEFCELVSEQIGKINKIREEIDLDANRIKRSGNPLSEKLQMLLNLRREQDRRLEMVLLPHQIARLKNMTFYNIVVYEEGFSNSVVNGFIAELLALSIDEREVIKKEADKAREKYREIMRKAQLEAIKEIRGSIPEGKIENYDKLILPLLHGDKTFWRVDDSMLDTTRRTRIGARLSPLK